MKCRVLWSLMECRVLWSLMECRDGMSRSLVIVCNIHVLGVSSLQRTGAYNTICTVHV